MVRSKINTFKNSAAVQKNNTKQGKDVNFRSRNMLTAAPDEEMLVSNHNKPGKRIREPVVTKQSHLSKVQSRSRGRIASTKMPPYNLMQKEDQDEPHDQLDEDSEDEIQAGYLNFYVLKQHLQSLERYFPHVNMTIEVIGRTVEYKDIVLIKATETQSQFGRHFRAEDKYVDEVPEKPIIFIVHGLSPRGMCAVPCLCELRSFKTLLEYYFKNLDKFDIFIIPVANPDTSAMQSLKHMQTLMWDKNRSPQETCQGVSLDRNFDVAWNETDVKLGPCSPLYPGPRAFSEPETQAIKNIFHYYGHKISAYLNVHASSFSALVLKGDAVLYPKGFSDTPTDDDKYIDLRADIEEAMKNGSFHTVHVTVDTLHSWYGKISGSSVDYASTVYGIPYAMELLMQPVSDEDNHYSSYALSGIWSRVIDTIFNNIYANTRTSDNT